MMDAKQLAAQAVEFTDMVNQGREGYTGGPKYFEHMGNKREADWPWLTDAEIAGMVRMLLRTDVGHEAVVCAARDRILHLSQENERLKQELYGRTRSLEEALKR